MPAHSLPYVFPLTASAALQVLAQQQAEAAVFDTSRLVDFTEAVQCTGLTVQLTPLVREAGCLAVTDACLYFQPLHNVTGDSPVRVFALSDVAAMARRRSSLKPTGRMLHPRLCECVEKWVALGGLLHANMLLRWEHNRCPHANHTCHAMISPANCALMAKDGVQAWSFSLWTRPGRRPVCSSPFAASWNGTGLQPPLRSSPAWAPACLAAVKWPRPVARFWRLAQLKAVLQG